MYIQDLAWSVLPKEFKEEVKKEYLVHHESGDMKYSYGYSDALTDFFGEHNLTSDAEEDEMLYVSRKEAQGLFRACNGHKHRCFINGDSTDFFDGEINVLTILFGSKCLPDEVVVAENATTTEPKPAGPKFKVGDKTFFVFSPMIKYKCTITKVMQNEHNGKWEYDVLFEWGKPGKWVLESDLEPYTEPQPATECSNLDKEPSTCTDDCPSQCKSKHRNLSQETANCDKEFGTILKDGFRNERRLNIAVQILSGIVASSKPCKHPVKRALELTDALIGECGKGGSDGN